jgi:hypothetical protein
MTRGESLGGRVGHGGVGLAVKDDRGRCAFFHVVGGREIFRGGAHAVGGHAIGEITERETGQRGENERGIEEHEGVGHGADGGVFAGRFETGERGEGGGEVSAGRTATGGDAARIDAEAGGVGADPAERGLRVGDAIDGFYIVARGDAVVGGDGDQAAGGEGAAVLFKLGG